MSSILKHAKQGIPAPRPDHDMDDVVRSQHPCATDPVSPEAEVTKALRQIFHADEIEAHGEIVDSYF
ncbi:hypothetical protein [Burkholderia vietnamiensis]|uniref:hypothetical protein n=1 Tax=Burkholderia vietnamiensis TaxID=60552 RepID=UPI001CF24298|nr:hypothetical protein [Burkholderia vietnamiensis]MCA8448923.1 hypothetical protein [Burkholderia vietnamiensis]